MNSHPLRVGIGGPVGSGKTALTLALCRALRERYNLAVVTNDSRLADSILSKVVDAVEGYYLAEVTRIEREVIHV